MKKKRKIAIIGAGFSGTTLALALQESARKNGVEITLIDKLLRPLMLTPRYLALSYYSRLVYERLKIWDLISQNVNPIFNIDISDQTNFYNVNLNYLEHNISAFGYVVENMFFKKCLLNSLDDTVVNIRYSTVTSLHAVKNGYSLTCLDGSHITCDLAILADGSFSRLRDKIGINSKKIIYNKKALMTNVTLETSTFCKAFEKFTKNGGSIAILPLYDNYCHVIWICNEDEINRLNNLSNKNFIIKLQNMFDPCKIKFIKLIEKRYCYPLIHIEALEQIRHNLVLIGNSSHTLHPIAGQGFNLALRDIISLSDFILDNIDNEKLGNFYYLTQYLNTRKLDQNITIYFLKFLLKIFSYDNIFMMILRNIGLIGFDLFCPKIKNIITNKTIGLM